MESVLAFLQCVLSRVCTLCYITFLPLSFIMLHYVSLSYVLLGLSSNLHSLSHRCYYHSLRNVTKLKCLFAIINHNPVTKNRSNPARQQLGPNVLLARLPLRIGEVATYCAPGRCPKALEALTMQASLTITPPKV